MQLEREGRLEAGFCLRPGGEDELQAVFRLNRAVFAERWSYQALHAALASGYDLLLCEYEGKLAGYLLSLGMLDTVEIMQIAVAAPFRRRGLAAAMTRALIRASPGARRILLEVRASNRAARALYSGLGFAEEGVRKGYYSPNVSGLAEDAVLMSLKL